MDNVFMNGLVTGISSMLEQNSRVNGQSGNKANSGTNTGEDFAKVLGQAIADSLGTNTNNVYGNMAYSGLYNTGLLGNSLYGSSLYGGLFGSGLYGSGLYGSGLYGNSLYGSGLYGMPFNNYALLSGLYSGKGAQGSSKVSGASSSSRTSGSIGVSGTTNIEQIKQMQRNRVQARLVNSSAADAYKKHMAMMA